jgi:hypothetical protein
MGQEAMRRGLFVLSMFVLLAMSAQDARAAEFGVRYSYHPLQDLTEKGPKGEDLALGYISTMHSFILPYKVTGEYALIVKRSAKDLNGRMLNVYHELSPEKIEQMQRAGTLPNPLPPYRHTIAEYLMGYVLWWCVPVTLLFIALFSKLGIGTGTRDETRPARR